jgi:hypothetical protein
VGAAVQRRGLCKARYLLTCNFPQNVGSSTSSRFAESFPVRRSGGRIYVLAHRAAKNSYCCKIVMQPSSARKAARLLRLCHARLRGLGAGLIPPGSMPKPPSGLRCRGVQTRAGPTKGHPEKPSLEDLKATFATVAKLGAAAYVIQVYCFNSTMVRAVRLASDHGTGRIRARN